ncbi:PAS domain-containing protein [Sphingomonas sp. CFBP 13733]|uniref:PAS domain-containing protein n=1 Tax=Sphingomonas sp. CFBP 13733 TaxID=2775291 RepID=UPI00177EB9B8|nr:PAS domain-containing protein [Sphingomonas sp. CFBP 13733]MBD8641939.1 PAS domain-containing protein [Sphingomonas sp. CFBP 13733]
MPAGHCVSSVEGVILHADQGFLDLLQRRADEVIGVSYRQVTDARDLDRSADMLAVLEDGAAPVRLQKRYLRPDGSSVVANLLVTRFANPDRLISTLFWQENGRPLPPARLWEAALRMRQVHATRAMLFGADLSTDPIGSLLISIYLAEAEGRNIGLADAAAHANIPTSVTERWIRVMQQRGVIEYQKTTIDIRLTSAGTNNIESMLSSFYEPPNAVQI